MDLECEELLMTDTLPQEPDLKFAIDLARLADQTRCHNVVLLDLRRKSPVTKYFLIATGTSDRQRRTVGDELIAHGKLNGFPAWRSNGYETAKWIVVDFVDVVAHVFEEASRNFYDLEMLWGDCPRVPWQLPQPETAAPSAASEPLPEITRELEGIMPAPARSDADVGLDSEAPAGQTDEPQVEEFVDEEILVAQVTDNREPVKTTAVEILAVHAAPSRAATPGKKPKAAAVKPAAKIAGKAAKAARAKAAAQAKMTTNPARRAKPPAVKIAGAKAAAGRPTKAGKLFKSRAARPGARKTAAKKTIAKKITSPRSAAKKTRPRRAAGKRRSTVAEPLKKPAVKTKKR